MCTRQHIQMSVDRRSESRGFTVGQIFLKIKYFVDLELAHALWKRILPLEYSNDSTLQRPEWVVKIVGLLRYPSQFEEYFYDFDGLDERNKVCFSFRLLLYFICFFSLSASLFHRLLYFVFMN